MFVWTNVHPVSGVDGKKMRNLRRSLQTQPLGVSGQCWGALGVLEDDIDPGNSPRKRQTAREVGKLQENQ